jgi:hypothetical protein
MKIIHIIPLIILLASCTHDYFPSTGSDETLICMNARLNTADTLHKVQIKGSDVNRTVSMTGAVVTLQVGDAPSDTARVRSDGFAYFNSIIKASDIVTLSSGKASATVSGLQVPEGDILEASYSLTGKKATVKARIRRNPDTDNLYILQLVTYQHAIRDNDKEVLLDRSTIYTLNLESYPLQKYPRMFLVDSDAFLDDDSCDITVEGLTEFLEAHKMSSLFGRIENNKQVFEPESYTRTILFCARISALNRDDYWTLRYLVDDPAYALGPNLNGVLSMLPLETIPKTYPGNVSGGIGLVSVRSALEIPIAKWVCHYDIHNYFNPDASPIPVQ